MKIFIATKNQKKLKELERILLPIGFEVLSINDFPDEFPDVDETGSTFRENATLKAEAIYKLIGKPTISDDSGFNVDFLNGEPGIYSARYLGVNTPSIKKCEKIIDLLKNVEEEKRTAKFVCVICFIDKNGETHLFRGECKGKISQSIRGENGFGYDPIFEVDGETFAEMEEEKKNEISHRHMALKQFEEFIEKNSDL